MFSYAFGQAIFGKIFDWIGTRLGFVLSIGVWSIATALHALATSFGLFARKALQELDESFYNLVMDVNFKSTVFVIQAFEPFMGKSASIINLSSLAARDGGGSGSSLYSASKGAVSTFTKAMAKELGPKGIRVNAVCPGLIGTKFHDDFTSNEIRDKVANSTPLRREGLANEVADLIAYLASDESSFITGNNIDINGGLAFS